jgi:hypothetical protein
MEKPSKVCPACGRSFEWRKRWERNWEAIVYCSKRCSGTKGKSQDTMALAAAIETHVRASPRGECFAASVFSTPLDANDRAPHRARQDVLAAIRLLAHRGVVEILHGGRVTTVGKRVLVKGAKVVSPDEARGEFYIRRLA